jgi:pyruvate kinase
MKNTVTRKRTKIVATIGPASRDPAVLRALILAGVNVVRLNFSHGNHEEHGAVIADVRAIAAELHTWVAVLQDLPGPKVRTGDFATGIESVALTAGGEFELTVEPILGTCERVSVQYDGLANDVMPGALLYLADGAIALRVLSKSATCITTRVEVGGELRARQGINYPDGTLSIEAVTERDYEHLAYGLAQDVDWVAISFVKSPEEVLRVRDFMRKQGKVVPIIAKIEKHEALDAIEAIVEASDGIMVARGDLGIEIPLESVPLWQKRIITHANRRSKPVITATQMLESMIHCPRPTRAEAADVANAILDGTDAVMLSGETARGAWSVEAVRVMATIAREIEAEYPHEQLTARRSADALPSIADTIAESAAYMAESLGLELIVTGTTTGNTARHISSFRPHARVIAFTPFMRVARRLALVWGVEAILVEPYRYIETLIEIAEREVLARGFGQGGDVVAITSGMPVGEGGTNLVKLHMLPHQR